jgi:hypothetical protein
VGGLLLQQFIHTRLLQEEVDPLRIEYFIRRGTIEIQQHALTRLNRVTLTDQTKVISAIVDLDPQAAFDVAQVVIELPTEVGQPFVVDRFKVQIQGVGMFSQW